MLLKKLIQYDLKRNGGTVVQLNIALDKVQADMVAASRVLPRWLVSGVFLLGYLVARTKAKFA